MHNPQEIHIFTTEEILCQIYTDEELEETTTEEVTQGFVKWINEHDALFYPCPDPEDAAVIVEGVMATIRAGKKILIMAHSVSSP